MENHLQKCLVRGYVGSQEGNLRPFIRENPYQNTAEPSGFALIDAWATRVAGKHKIE